MSLSPHCRASLTDSQQDRPIMGSSEQQTSDEHDSLSLLLSSDYESNSLYNVEKNEYFLLIVLLSLFQTGNHT